MEKMTWRQLQAVLDNIPEEEKDRTAMVQDDGTGELIELHSLSEPDEYQNHYFLVMWP